MHKNCFGCSDQTKPISRKRKTPTVYGPMKINNEPIIRYSENVYKSLLEEHNLMDESNDTLSTPEDQDPLALNSADIIQRNQVKEFDQSEISVNDSEVLQIKSECDDDMLIEEQILQEQIVDNNELIKIEIVGDDVEGISNGDYVKQTENNQLLSPKKEILVVEMSPEDIQNLVLASAEDASTTERPINSLSDEQNIQINQENTNEPATDLPCTIKPEFELRSSCRLLSTVNLTFIYGFNCDGNTEEQKLLYFTDITSEILDVCEKCMENTFYAEGIDYTGSIRSKIVLVLTKLKTNLHFEVLATLLGIQEDLCIEIFYTTLHVFSESLKPAICWLDEEDFDNDRAKIFGRVKIVLNKLIFKVKKCTKRQCGFAFCEKYKKHKVVNVLIGLSPKGGLFSYVSDPYDSRTDPHIVLRKDILLSQQCCKGDVVMILGATNDYLLLFEDCKRHGIELKTIDELQLIAQVYIYDTFRKLAKFEILNSKEISSHMVPSIGKAVSVICAVLNLKFEAAADNKLSDVV